MKAEELSRYGGLKRHIAVLQEELQLLGTDTIRSMAMDGMPHGSSSGDPTGTLAIRIASISQEIEKSQKEAHAESVKILEFLHKVQTDQGIQVEDRDTIYDILHYRFLDLLSWEDIGRLCNMDRRTASRKAYAYLDAIKTCPQCPE